MRCPDIITNLLKTLLAFSGGFALGQLYYYYLLKQIPFPGYLGSVFSVAISFILGLCNAVSTQIRCISVLIFAMYCGKPGRGVLKAVILTYIVTGPIRNMGLNAREVVRVFACSIQLAYNLSREEYDLMLSPVRKGTLGVRDEVKNLKDIFRTMKDIIEPIQQEIESSDEIRRIRFGNDVIDDLFNRKRRSENIEMTFQNSSDSDDDCIHEWLYKMKLQYRCESELSRATAICIQEFTKAYKMCCDLVPSYAELTICFPLKMMDVCDLSDSRQNYTGTSERSICEAPIELGLGKAYVALQNVKKELVDKLDDVYLQYKIKNDKESHHIQDAKETAERVQHAFQEKTIIMHHVSTAMNVCMALLFLRILHAAIKYHDIYLTSIDYDNVYITGYFKTLDCKRKMSRKYTLLPLKKMERNKYTDISSLSYKESQRSNLIMQILKVMLEVVTATTFVMLDRLFYEALQVVRQHAEMEVLQQGTRDLDMQVEGIGILATMLRKFLNSLSADRPSHQLSNSACLPHPWQMPYLYFLKIYGGYLWIIILLFANPYTLRLRRLICSYFYPHREKQRILHLYNDILKKRMKMQKTLRRKAVQSVRAHYLSGETLLSVRMKFPQILGWLHLLPAARMACLICDETEPRNHTQRRSRNSWYSCVASKCPFVYCAECWREVGARCLACEPSLAEFSDVDSLTDDEPLRY